MTVRADLAPRLLAAAREPTAWPDLARAIGRSPKDGTARRLRDDLLGSGELVRLDDGRLRVPDRVPDEVAPQEEPPSPRPDRTPPWLRRVLGEEGLA